MKKISINPNILLPITFGILSAGFFLLHSFMTVSASADNFTNYSFPLGQAGFLFGSWSRIMAILTLLSLFRGIGKILLKKRRESLKKYARYAFRIVYLLLISYEIYMFAYTLFMYMKRMVAFQYFSGGSFRYSLEVLFIVAGVCTLSAVLCFFIGYFPGFKKAGGYWRTVSLALSAACMVHIAVLADVVSRMVTGAGQNGFAAWLITLAGIYFCIRISLMMYTDLRVSPEFACPPVNIRFPRFVRANKKKPEKTDRLKSSILQRYTGLSFKSLWTIRYTVSLIPVSVLGIILLLFLSTAMYTVEPYQEALLYHFGALDENSVKGPGLHFKLPWPFERFEIYDVDRVKSLQVGFLPSESKDFLWTSRHGGEEYTLMLGNGNELIAVNIKLSYSIEQLADYATRYENPEEMLVSKTYEFMMQKTIESDLDTILSVDRQILSRELCDGLRAFSREQRLGLYVGEVVVENIHPPVDVAEVYQNAINASVQKNIAILTGEAEAVNLLNGAQQTNQTSVIRAQYTQIRDIAQAWTDMAVYGAEYEAHSILPESYELIKTMSAYDTIISSEKIYVFSEGTKDDMAKYWIGSGYPLAIE